MPHNRSKELVSAKQCPKGGVSPPDVAKTWRKPRRERGSPAHASNSVVETTNAAAVAFVRLRIRLAQYTIEYTEVVEDARLSPHHLMLCAGIQTNRRRHTLTVPIVRKRLGRYRNDTTFSKAILAGRVKHRGARAVGRHDWGAKWDPLWGHCVADARSGARPTYRLGGVMVRVRNIVRTRSLSAPIHRKPAGTVFVSRIKRSVHASAGRLSSYVDRRLWSHHGFDGQRLERLFH